MNRHCDKCNLSVSAETVLTGLCVDRAAHHLVDAPPGKSESYYSPLFVLFSQPTTTCVQLHSNRVVCVCVFTLLDLYTFFFVGFS